MTVVTLNLPNEQKMEWKCQCFIPSRLEILKCTHNEF